VGELRLLCKRRRPNELCYCAAFNCRFQVQGDGVCVVYESVEYGVGECGFADDVLPVLDRQLCGDEG